MTPCHEEAVHIFYRYWVPEHGPRAGDPHYRLFEAARARLKRAGKLVCWRCGADEEIELHHNKVEWCLANAVDPAKFAHRYPELMPDCDEETFLRAIEQEGGLLALCRHCHTGKGSGIHYVPYPVWVAGGLFRAGLPDPAVIVATMPVNVAGTPDEAGEGPERHDDNG